MHSLQINKTTDDFDANLEDDSFTSDGFSELTTTAMGAGGTALSLKPGLAPGYGAGLSVLSTVLSLISDSAKEDEPSTVDRSWLENSLSYFFSSPGKGLEQTAQLAVGRAWEGESYDLLPQMTTEHAEQVVNFYDHAFRLLDDGVKPVNDVIAAVSGLKRLFVVDIITQGLDDAVSWETGIESSKDCGDRAGRRWLDIDGGDRCFTFVHATDNTGSYSEVPLDTNLFEVMGGNDIDDLDSYYLTSIACAKSGSEIAQSVGVGDLDSELPICFYSLPVLKRAHWESRKCDGTSLIGCEWSNYVNFIEEEIMSSCEEKRFMVINERV